MYPPARCIARTTLRCAASTCPRTVLWGSATAARANSRTRGFACGKAQTVNQIMKKSQKDCTIFKCAHRTKTSFFQRYQRYSTAVHMRACDNTCLSCLLVNDFTLADSQEAKEGAGVHGPCRSSGAAPHRGAKGHDPPPNDGLVVAALRQPLPNGLVPPLSRVLESC